jgi:hypothetical protein
MEIELSKGDKLIITYYGEQYRVVMTEFGSLELKRL